MGERGQYSRVYWSVMDDPKFDGIRDDARLFGSWSLMLVVADMAWPSPAFVPPGVSRASLEQLAASGLVDRMAGHRYRIHGLQAEREHRSQSARNAAAVRWQSDRISDRNAEAMLVRERGLEENERVNGASTTPRVRALPTRGPVA